MVCGAVLLKHRNLDLVLLAKLEQLLLVLAVARRQPERRLLSKVHLEDQSVPRVPPQCGVVRNEPQGGRWRDRLRLLLVRHLESVVRKVATVHELGHRQELDLQVHFDVYVLLEEVRCPDGRPTARVGLRESRVVAELYEELLDQTGVVGLVTGLLHFLLEGLTVESVYLFTEDAKPPQLPGQLISHDALLGEFLLFRRLLFFMQAIPHLILLFLELVPGFLRLEFREEWTPYFA